MQTVGNLLRLGFLHHRTVVTLLASIALHVVTLTFTQGAVSVKQAPRVKGIPLQPVAIDVTIRPPELSENREIATASPSTSLPLPLFPPPKEAALRLLTLPPFPIEQIGAEALLQPDTAGIVPTNYVPTKSLTLRPKPTKDPQIHLPPGWLEAFGLATLTLYISAEGKVDAITFVQTDLPPELQDAVREAFLLAEFSPGEIDGRPVPTAMTIETNIALFLGRRR